MTTFLPLGAPVNRSKNNPLVIIIPLDLSVNELDAINQDIDTNQVIPEQPDTTRKPKSFHTIKRVKAQVANNPVSFFLDSTWFH